MATRNLLHRSKIDQFAAWCVAQGHTVERNMASFEVMRVRLAGVAVPILIYDRSSGDHLTLRADGGKLVRKWLWEVQGQGVVAPPTLSDSVSAIVSTQRRPIG